MRVRKKLASVVLALLVALLVSVMALADEEAAAGAGAGEDPVEEGVQEDGTEPGDDTDDVESASPGVSGDDGGGGVRTVTLTGEQFDALMLRLDTWGYTLIASLMSGVGVLLGWKMGRDFVWS